MPPRGFAAERDAGSAGVIDGVLEPRFLHKLDRLRLTVRHSLSTRPGNTPMPRGAQGSGIELESYRSYGAGDDLRHLDWNAYGRLDQLLVKTFRAQREAPLHIFLDAPASMAYPHGDGKMSFAVGLAASLAYINLRNHDPVCVAAINDDLPHAHTRSRWFRHRQRLPELRDFLLNVRAAGKTALDRGIDAALGAQRSSGVAVLISDFLVEPSRYEAACAALLARRFTVAFLRVIGPAERDPRSSFQNARLIDAESGEERYVTLGAQNAARYQSALAAHLGRLQGVCSRSGVAFAIADSGASLERCLFRDLPAAGVVH
jgi:uncharacterized protein (DUF58 family)